MNPWLVTAVVSLVLGAIPLVAVLRNLKRVVPPEAGPMRPSVNVLVPARDEERNIEDCVRSILAASEGADVEVVVLDDHSKDHTASIVEALSIEDARVRLERAPELPAGWCGKMHALHVLAARTDRPVMVFLDADVRLAPGAVAKMASFLDTSGAALASGFPQQKTGSFLEHAVIPLIQFVLLGFLPLGRMRTTTDPSVAAGCGQLFVVRREAYERSGGHAAIRATLHDGLEFPRNFRRSGLRTDLFDATDLATCRMYEGFSATWRGLHKNAHEGMGKPAVIGPASVLLLGGQVLPWFLAASALAGVAPAVVGILSVVAIVASLVTRGLVDTHVRASPVAKWLHPVGVTVLVAAQWYGLFRRLTGGSSTWRGRSYPSAQAA